MHKQPPPTPTTGMAIVDLVMMDILKRKEDGIKKYGTPLQAFNGRDSLQDCYEEAVDLAIYLRQLIEERSEQTVQAGPVDEAVAESANREIVPNPFVGCSDMPDDCLGSVCRRQRV